MHHIPENALRLRILLGESDRWENQPTYEAIVLAARAAGLAGATVLHGPMGFGAGSRVHTAKILQLSADLAFGPARPQPAASDQVGQRGVGGLAGQPQQRHLAGVLDFAQRFHGLRGPHQVGVP